MTKIRYMLVHFCSSTFSHGRLGFVVRGPLSPLLSAEPFPEPLLSPQRRGELRFCVSIIYVAPFFADLEFFADIFLSFLLSPLLGCVFWLLPLSRTMVLQNEPEGV